MLRQPEPRKSSCPPRSSISSDQETKALSNKRTTMNCSCSSTSERGFTTLPPVLLKEQSAVVLLLKRDLVSWLLAIDECDGHEDLCGSGHRSVIPYIHGRIELYCSSLPCVSLFSDRPCEVVHARAFYSSTSCSYIETRDPIGWHNGAGHVQYSRMAGDKIRHTHVVEDII
jgi:hypothetical protein